MAYDKDGYFKLDTPAKTMQISITRDQALVALDALYERRRTCVEKIGLYANAKDWYMVDAFTQDVKNIETLQDILASVVDADLASEGR